jgi:peptidoglycan/LPS O-acetylase OafA/YrhL
MNAKNYRADIQRLRALSVGAVFLFHLAPNFVPNGYLGVDVFFVISGFVIYPLLLRIFNEKDFKCILIGITKFYSARFYRLAPALGIVLSAFLLIIFLFASPDEHLNISQQAFAGLIVLGNIGAYKFSGNYFNPEPNPLIHIWTLSTEEQIYIFLPLFFMTFTFIRLKLIYKTFPIFIISLYIFLNQNMFSELYSKYGIELAQQLNFYSPVSRIWEFLLGCYAYNSTNKSIKNQTWIKILFVILFFGIILFPTEINQKFATVIIVLTTVLLILLKVLNIKISTLSNTLEKIGNRSYVIYLVHLPVIYVVSSIILKDIKINFMVRQIVIVIITAVVSEIIHKKIEQKYRKFGTNKKNIIEIKVIVKFFLIPACLAWIIIIGGQNSYWGLNKNEVKPPYAGYADSNCERDSYNGPPCVYSERKSASKVLLIGDSHAGHFSQAVVDSALKANLDAIIWTHSGCRFQTSKSSNYEVHPNCIQVNREIVAYIKNQRPEIVILSQALPQGAQLKDIKNGISQLNKISKKLFIIEQTPMFPDGKNFLKSKPIYLGKVHYKEIFDLRDMDHTTNKEADEIRAFAVSNKIEIINVNSIFCDGKKCRRKHNQKWLYSDANHLSIYGASLTIPKFEKIFKDLR